VTDCSGPSFGETFRPGLRADTLLGEPLRRLSPLRLDPAMCVGERRNPNRFHRCATASSKRSPLSTAVRSRSTKPSQPIVDKRPGPRVWQRAAGFEEPGAFVPIQSAYAHASPPTRSTCRRHTWCDRLSARSGLSRCREADRDGRPSTAFAVAVGDALPGVLVPRGTRLTLPVEVLARPDDRDAAPLLLSTRRAVGTERGRVRGRGRFWWRYGATAARADSGQ
jgi:hypothetical protein